MWPLDLREVSWLLPELAKEAGFFGGPVLTAPLKCLLGPLSMSDPTFSEPSTCTRFMASSKPPDLRGATSLTHAATREEAAKKAFEQRWELVYKKFVAAKWPGAHDIPCKPTSGVQSVTKLGKVDQTACHKCRRCGMEIRRTQIPRYMCPLAKNTKKPLERSERVRLWAQWRQEASVSLGCYKTVKKTRCNSSQKNKAKGLCKRPAAACSA